MLRIEIKAPVGAPFADLADFVRLVRRLYPEARFSAGSIERAALLFEHIEHVPLPKEGS
jgi:hypothetical protein